MKTRIIFLLVLAVGGIIISYTIRTSNDSKKILPVFNPVDMREEMVDSSIQRVGYGHIIGDFAFLNQDGNTITQEDVKGKVFVAEYFFTTCGTICPRMNKQMQRVQKEFAKNPNVKILSFTVMPEVDTVEQMKRYATQHKAITGQWHFLTGEKKDLYSLARKSFFVLKPAEAENLGDAGSDFIHTNNFVLVDKGMQIRGYYDGTSAKDVSVLLEDIKLLLEEK
jgi:protein SCO1/2